MTIYSIIILKSRKPLTQFGQEVRLYLGDFIFLLLFF